MSSKTIMTNLPAKDLAAAKKFVLALGMTDKGSCSGGTNWFGYGESTTLFYHDHATFNKWLPEGSKAHTYDNPAANTTEVIVTLGAEAREDVDRMIASAIEAGGKKGPMMISEEEQNKYGMYSRSVIDPDGHVFEVVYFPDHS